MHIAGQPRGVGELAAAAAMVKQTPFQLSHVLPELWIRNFLDARHVMFMPACHLLSTMGDIATF